LLDETNQLGRRWPRVRIAAQGLQPIRAMTPPDKGLKRLRATRVSERMSRGAPTTTSDGMPTVSSRATLDRAARIMFDSRVNHLLVVDAGTTRPVGTLSALDMFGVHRAMALVSEEEGALSL
jgi:hypothetical protein